MKNPIENLGDYNKVREDLQAAGGCIETLYKNIGDTAVSKATPGIFLAGSLLTVAGIVVIFIGYKGVCFLKDRKQKIENEPALKKEFIEAIEEEIRKDKSVNS